MPAITAYTSIAANYLPKARVLAHSIKQHAPNVHMVLVLVDTLPDGQSRESFLANEPFDDVLLVEQLGIPNWQNWLFRHSVVEACTAVKPFALLKLLESSEQVFYFDPDIALFSDIDALSHTLASHDAVLTPHNYVAEKTRDAVIDNELCFHKHGLYNLGFIGVRHTEQGKALAHWWADRCYAFCYDDIPNGIFTDQKWMDAAPLFFDDIHILKEPQYNVCTWNYSARRIEGSSADGFTVNNVPLCFHHFSGYDSGAHSLMRDKYGKEMPAALRLSDWYEQACQDAGQGSTTYVWAYGHYENGDAIRPYHRWLMRQRRDLQDAYPNPYALTSPNESLPPFIEWLKREGHYERERYSDGDENMTFGRFMEETEQRLEGFLGRTQRMRHWQKKMVTSSIRTLFGAVQFCYRRAGASGAK